MKEIELFDYLALMKNQNTLDGMPIDDLKAVLTGDTSTDYELATDSIYFMSFKNKNTDEIHKIQCVNNYYNLNISSSNGKLKCYNIKKEFMNRDIPHCRPENCAKCHVACIDDFYDGKISKK